MEPEPAERSLVGSGRSLTAAAEESGRRDIRDETAAFLNRLLDAMLAWQGEDGRFHDILDEPESFPDGASSAMMAAAVFRGILHGYVSDRYLNAAETAYGTVAEKTDGMGLIHEVCGCPDFISEGTSAEAQAAFVMANAWRERLNARGPQDRKPAAEAPSGG